MIELDELHAGTLERRLARYRADAKQARGL